MAAAQLLGSAPEDYSGPTREELGSLAEWLDQAEPIDHGPLPALRPGTVAEDAPSRTAIEVEANYEGPTREELGDLGRWLTEAESPPVGPALVDHPRPSRRAVDGFAIWEADLTGPQEIWIPASEARGGVRPEGPSSENVLAQLDDIEASLRKRTAAPPWREGRSSAR